MSAGRMVPRRETPPPPSPEAHAQGLSLWLPTRDAKRLALLARDYDESFSDTLARLIDAAFRARERVA